MSAKQRLSRIARYSATGPFAGTTQMLREVSGRQNWLVRIKIKNGEQHDEHEILSKEPCLLGVILNIVLKSIEELVPAGGKVEDAEMEFFTRSKR